MHPHTHTHSLKVDAAIVVSTVILVQIHSFIATWLNCGRICACRFVGINCWLIKGLLAVGIRS